MIQKDLWTLKFCSTETTFFSGGLGPLAGRPRIDKRTNVMDPWSYVRCPTDPTTPSFKNLSLKILMEKINQLQLRILMITKI